jgi:hypothetical protein
MKEKCYCEICKDLITEQEFDDFSKTVVTKTGFVHTNCLEAEYQGVIEFDPGEDYDSKSSDADSYTKE